MTAAVGTYREFMRTFAGMTNLDVWYAQANVDPVHGRFFQELDKTGRRSGAASRRRAPEGTCRPLRS